jgi:hypothetical protein
MSRPKKNHGLSHTPQHIAWQGMVARCTNPNHIGYDRYGGKGIFICTRWLTYLNYLKDMGERPEGMSIERIDNSKGYNPENCIWATSHTQARNRSQNINLTYNGITMCMRDWSNHLNIPYPTVYDRYRRGKNTEQMLHTKYTRKPHS